MKALALAPYPQQCGRVGNQVPLPQRAGSAKPWVRDWNTFALLSTLGLRREAHQRADCIPRVRHLCTGAQQHQGLFFVSAYPTTLLVDETISIDKRGLAGEVRMNSYLPQDTDMKGVSIPGGAVHPVVVHVCATSSPRCFAGVAETIVYGAVHRFQFSLAIWANVLIKPRVCGVCARKSRVC